MTEHSLKAAQDKAQQQEKHRQKRMLRTAVGLLLLSGVIGGGTFVLERVRANERPIHDDTTIADMKPDKQAARFARANELRDKWEPWAREHAADLKAMLSGDRAAHERVLSALPTMPELGRYGLGINEVSGNAMSSNAVHFAFGFDLKTSLFSDPNLSPEQRASNTELQSKLNKQFAKGYEAGFTKFHDVMIFQASNSGSKTAQVWASGRVTEEATVPNPTAQPGQPAFVTTQREVAPAYNFVG